LANTNEFILLNHNTNEILFNMPIPEYISEIPIPEDLIPAKLKKLLTPVDMKDNKRVEVALYQSTDQYGPSDEHVQMLMAVVPSNQLEEIKVFDEAGDGVLGSAPIDNQKGGCRNFRPNLSGYEYVVAAQGDHSFFGYILSENIWITLGLTPRCEGGSSQTIRFDDLSAPVFSVAAGEASNEYYFKASRDVCWTISNEYLRKFLWLKDCYGVRVFYYSKRMPDSKDIRQFMNGEKFFLFKSASGWCELDIREHEGDLLIQLWASVIAVTPEKLPEPETNNLKWPDLPEAISKEAARAGVEDYIFLDDRFLEKYEQNSLYNSTPAVIRGLVYCSPGYKGQWMFRDCVRVGRNFIRTPLNKLYEGLPSQELLHAHKYAVPEELVQQTHPDVENIVLKTNRFLECMLDLGSNFSLLATHLDIEKTSIEIVKLDPEKIAKSGWDEIPIFMRLAQVATAEMSEQFLLARCKTIFEVWQRIPDGFLRQLLTKAGCPIIETRNLGSLKLLQAVLNILECLNKNAEEVMAFNNEEAHDGWNLENRSMAPMFLLNELRMIDAHALGKSTNLILEEYQVDTSTVVEGYGLALDTIFDAVIDCLENFNSELHALLSR